MRAGDLNKLRRFGKAAEIGELLDGQTHDRPIMRPALTGKSFRRSEGIIAARLVAFCKVGNAMLGPPV